MINISVQPRSNGDIGYDVDDNVTSLGATSYLNKGMTFILRYIGRNATVTNQGDLNSEEAQLIVDSGLALGIVQHCRGGRWAPSASLGTNDGQAAATICGNLGIPTGVTVWLDLEEVMEGVHPQDVIDHCNNWYSEIAAAGYVPGMYVGSNPGLSPDQMESLSMTSFWKSLSSAQAGVPDHMPGYGYQMVQYSGGDSDDLNRLQPDDNSEMVQFVVTSVGEGIV